MIKLIIFDVGGVIDTFDESQYIDYLSMKFGLDKHRFRAALIPLLDRMEVGKLSLKRLKRRLSRRLGISQKELEWDTAFEKLNSTNEDVIKLINNNLYGKYKIAILTNVSRSRHLIKMRVFLGNVKNDRIFASCYIKLHKPEKKVYEFVLDKMHVLPSETIFIDNLRKNVDGARSVGIHAIQFRGYKDMVNRLRKLGVKW